MIPHIDPANPKGCVTPIRVRYAETDQMQIVHHVNYGVWLEMGRTDLLRVQGQTYAEWEARGIRIVVGELRMKYRKPAMYDDMVEVKTTVREVTGRKIIFAYRVERAGELLTEGESTHLVMGTDGRSRLLPDDVRAFLESIMCPE